MGDLSANFSKSEFTCHCGCGLMNMKPEAIVAFQAVRDILGMPMTVLSGTRCPKHNHACGGAKASQHMLGEAGDFRCADLGKLYEAALKVSAIHGIGIYLRPGGWIHLDVRALHEGQHAARWAEDGLKRAMPFDAAVKVLLGK
jgi:hypothetical protein